VEFTTTPEHYMVAADIFCLPSYREGFGMTIIEAAACSIPAVASKIYGITDAVDDDVTGMLFPAGDVDALALALQKLIVNDELRKQMGKDARVRAVNLFSSDRISKEMVMLYDSLVNVH
jgi:glycosyltransferase involved in cell wall biosynthesis